MFPNTAIKKTKVLVVDDHAIVRAGLRALLATAADLDVVGEAEDGRQAVLQAVQLQPDVILLDLSMPLLNGVEATRQLALAVPRAKVLILSSYDDEQHFQQALAAGAAGYLLKASAAEHLLQAVREIAQGGASFSPPLLHRLYTQAQPGAPVGKTGATRSAALTIREAEVLQLIAERFGSKQIADVLSLSIKTVERHRQTLMDKLDLHKVAALTRYAVSSGVVEEGRSTISKTLPPPSQSREKRATA